MSLLNFLKNKEQNDKSPDSKNFVDDLIETFKSTIEVNDAYFGYMYNNNTNNQHLFLSVGLTSNEEGTKSMTWLTKSKYYPDLVLHFASNLSDPNIYDFIKTHNFSFYEKTKSKTLEQKMMRQWFEPEKYKKEFIDTLRQSKISTLLKDFDKESHIINFQTYIRKSGEFIPLFSDREMIKKSGMTNVPSNLTAVEFDFQKLNSILNNGLSNKFFVLNPGTAFEIEFYA
jgi:type III secretion system (T3SS) SseB-like protein